MNTRREAVVRMMVRGPRGGEEEIEAIVDTGFSGFLTLPRDVVARLELPFQDRIRAVLADGSEILFDVYNAEITWDGHPRRVLAWIADTEPLLGTSLLDGCELTIRFVDRGDVFIEALP